MWRADSLKKTLILAHIEGRRRGRQRTRSLEGITDQRTWIWANLRRWWRTGNPGMLQSMGFQRVRHNWVTERQQKLTTVNCDSTMRACLLSCFSSIWLFATLWTVAPQAPLSSGFFNQEHWSGMSCPPPGDLPYSGIKPMSHVSCIGRQVLYHQHHLGSPNQRNLKLKEEKEKQKLQDRHF